MSGEGISKRGSRANLVLFEAANGLTEAQLRIMRRSSSERSKSKVNVIGRVGMHSKMRMRGEMRADHTMSHWMLVN